MNNVKMTGALVFGVLPTAGLLAVFPAFVGNTIGPGALVGLLLVAHGLGMWTMVLLAATSRAQHVERVRARHEQGKCGCGQDHGPGTVEFNQIDKVNDARMIGCRCGWTATVHTDEELQAAVWAHINLGDCPLAKEDTNS